jgi:hypothetical protein
MCTCVRVCIGVGNRQMIKVTNTGLSPVKAKTCEADYCAGSGNNALHYVDCAEVCRRCHYCITLLLPLLYHATTTTTVPRYHYYCCCMRVIRARMVFWGRSLSLGKVWVE